MSLTKEFLSGSTLGRQIKVVNTVAGSADTIHTVSNTSNIRDEIWLYCTNQDTVYRTLTLLWGSTTSPDDYLTVDIPPKAGDILVIAGKVLGQALIVKAFASAANVLMISGFVNRYIP